MATLVLTAVGTAVGGPIGGMVGAIVGQQIDAQLFKPKGREGPRLGDLSIQTSSYGSAIPKLFGAMRVAGTVIWATDLKETKSTSGGGKGKPKTTSYSYSASFAVALSARRVTAVRRIWADGKLLRGAAGDFKSETKFRFYAGGEDQPVDPLIASVEGLGQTPAFRGTAYAMFEDFQLEDYANHIPSLTFEVEADPGPVAIGAIAERLSGGLVREAGTPALIGYAASGDSVRGVIEGLGDVVPLSLADTGAYLKLSAAPPAPLTIAASETGAQGSGRSGGRSEFARRAAATVPGEVTVAYHDPARDYQTGLQRATRGGQAHRTDRRALPAALGAGFAKGIAERRLAALWARRATGKLHLGWRRSAIRPGACLRIEGSAGLWKVARWTLDRMVVSLELVRVQAGQMVESAEASAGRPVGHPDLLHGPTTVRLLDLPLSGEQVAQRPLLLVAAAGVEAGWRRAALLVSYDGGSTWNEAGATAAPAVMGAALTALAPVDSVLIDTASHLEVELLNAAMWLEGRSDDALAAGANLALVGDELIQFGSAEPLGERRFRLSRLVRGRRGTEWAAAGHIAGEGFLLIEQPALVAIEPPPTVLGSEVRVEAIGIGDGDGAATDSRAVTGEALRPPSPAHLTAASRADGNIEIKWVRRSRGGWDWLSGSDTPLSEEAERYRLTLAGAGFERVIDVEEAAYLYTAAEQAADGLAGPLAVAVAQVGTYATSRAATLTLTT